MSRKIPASTADVAVRGSSGAMNCGSRVRKSNAIFGFSRLVSRPCRKAARAVGAGWDAGPSDGAPGGW